MGVCRRAALYLARKKGKAILLFLIFFLVSALLLICFSVLNGTGQAARDLDRQPEIYVPTSVLPFISGPMRR